MKTTKRTNSIPYFSILIATVAIIIVVTIATPIVIYQWELKSGNHEWKDYWGGYVGSAIGAIITMVGIIISIEANHKQSIEAMDANKNLLEEQMESNHKQLEKQNEENYKMLFMQLESNRRLMLEEKQIEMTPYFVVTSKRIDEDIVADISIDLCPYTDSTKESAIFCISVRNISKMPAVNMVFAIIPKAGEDSSSAESYEHDFLEPGGVVDVYLEINYDVNNLPKEEIDEQGDFFHRMKYVIAFNAIHNKMDKRYEDSKREFERVMKYEYSCSFLLDENVDNKNPYLYMYPL
jgi:hypothetical protein